MSELEEVTVQLPKRQREKYLLKNKCKCDLPSTDEDCEKTLRDWWSKSTKLAYIYDYMTDTYRTRLNRLAITSLILTLLTTMFALSNLGLKDRDYPTISIVLKGVNTLLALVASITTGIPKILNWSRTKDEYHDYFRKVEHLLSLLMSEESLPSHLRVNPERFILEHKEKYEMILDQAPIIPHSEYVKLLRIYEQSKARYRAKQ